MECIGPGNEICAVPLELCYDESQGSAHDDPREAGKYSVTTQLNASPRDDWERAAGMRTRVACRLVFGCHPPAPRSQKGH
jgi:hypothetical protein